MNLIQRIRGRLPDTGRFQGGTKQDRERMEYGLHMALRHLEKCAPHQVWNQSAQIQLQLVPAEGVNPDGGMFTQLGFSSKVHAVAFGNEYMKYAAPLTKHIAVHEGKHLLMNETPGYGRASAQHHRPYFNRRGR